MAHSHHYNHKSDFRNHYTQPSPSSDPVRTAATYIVYGLLAAYAIHQLLVYYDYPILPPQEIVWNALVYTIPKQLLLDRARRQELKANGMLSQTHAAKSDALRRMMGIGGNAVLQNLPGPAEGIVRRMSGVARRPQVLSDAPPGLGNWDNSCYQNSVLQGLASLGSLREYLGGRDGDEETEGTTTDALRRFVGSLNDEGNNGRHLWTPAKLKNMSSWQQQDAQEYYSKVLDELDKEATKAAKSKEIRPGLESLTAQDGEEQKQGLEEQTGETSETKNPLDGLLAQRVACTKCGYSEGLSMIPFNCLTLPLGSSQTVYPLEDCLDESTKLEEISDVECGKCTLLRAEQQLSRMLPPPPNYRAVDAEPAVNSSMLALPPDLRAQAFERLAKMQHALDEDDFADKTLHETCQIPKKSRVSSTKTRQAVIGRAPQSLVVHVQRSVFDEMTGVQRKNYAGVRWPATLDLSSWVLPTDADDELAPMDSLLTDGAAEDGGLDAGMVYKIKAVVTHYGRHENGHYICYRQYPTRVRVEEELDGVDEDEENDIKKEEPVEWKWWRLSDEDVSAVSEEEVLKQGGVFMLFYEREQMPEPPEPSPGTDAIITRTSDAATASIAAKDSVEGDGMPPLQAPSALATESDDFEVVDAEPSPTLPSSIEPGPSSTNPTTPASTTTASSSPFDEEGHPIEATTEDEKEAEPPATPQPMAKSPAPPTSPVMRTARSQRPGSPTNKDGGFGVGVGGFRPMATT